jgi:hypothetical protein
MVRILIFYLSKSKVKNEETKHQVNRHSSLNEQDNTKTTRQLDNNNDRQRKNKKKAFNKLANQKFFEKKRGQVTQDEGRGKNVSGGHGILHQ